MGRYLDIADEWERERRQNRSFDGHRVEQVIWETPRMVIFRDPDGQIWRRVHSWNMTWPVEVE